MKYFLFLKTMLKTRHVSANMIPTTASTSKIIATEISIEFITSKGVPSGGIPSTQVHDI